jgi:hypothetical protein
MIGPFRDAIVRSARGAVVPLVAYYTVTLLIPLANGALPRARSFRLQAEETANAGSGFGRHALVVVVVPCVLIALGAALRTIAGRVGSVFAALMSRSVSAGFSTPSVRRRTKSPR